MDTRYTYILHHINTIYKYTPNTPLNTLYTPHVGTWGIAGSLCFGLAFWDNLVDEYAERADGRDFWAKQVGLFAAEVETEVD